MAKDIDTEIDRLASQRQAAWAAGDAEEARRAGDKITALYEEKRSGAASHGTERKRQAAIKRAKAEQELDRLMQ